MEIPLPYLDEKSLLDCLEVIKHWAYLPEEGQAKLLDFARQLSDKECEALETARKQLAIKKKRRSAPLRLVSNDDESSGSD